MLFELALDSPDKYIRRDDPEHFFSYENGFAEGDDVFLAPVGVQVRMADVDGSVAVVFGAPRCGTALI